GCPSCWRSSASGPRRTAAPRRGADRMTLYRAQVLHTPDDPFRGGTLQADADAGLVVVDGMIVERGPYAGLRRQHHDEPVVDLGSGLLLPGFVDTHVHYPQMRAIGALGMPLLEVLGGRRPPRRAARAHTRRT